jgi:hypothetical protein
MSMMNNPNVEFLEVTLMDLQKIYKKIVILLPLSDIEANRSVIEVERQMNAIINGLCENIADA